MEIGILAKWTGSLEIPCFQCLSSLFWVDWFCTIQQWLELHLLYPSHLLQEHVRCLRGRRCNLNGHNDHEASGEVWSRSPGCSGELLHELYVCLLSVQCCLLLVLQQRQTKRKLSLNQFQSVVLQTLQWTQRSACFEGLGNGFSLLWHATENRLQRQHLLTEICNWNFGQYQASTVKIGCFTW